MIVKDDYIEWADGTKIKIKYPEHIKRAEPEDLADGYFSSNDGIEFYYVNINHKTAHKASYLIGNTAYLNNNYLDIFSDCPFYFDGKWGYLDKFLFECIGRYINKESKIWYHLRIEDVL